VSRVERPITKGEPLSTERHEEGTPLPPPEEDWDPEPRPGWGNQGSVPDTGPYHPMRELDSEDGPPPRRGGPIG